MREGRLSPAEHLAWLEENFAAVLAVPPDRLDDPVADCPGWRIDTVADHLARSASAFGQLMTSAPDQDAMPAILAGLPPHESGPAAMELASAHLEELLTIARGLDPDTPCRFVTGPATVATWLWHAACETWIHRADVEHALDHVPGLDAGRGMDCLRWSAAFRELVAAARSVEPAAVRCVATDTGDVVVVGASPPAGEVAGSASDLALRLWNRQHGSLDGDGSHVSEWACLAIASPLG